MILLQNWWSMISLQDLFGRLFLRSFWGETSKTHDFWPLRSQCFLLLDGWGKHQRNLDWWNMSIWPSYSYGLGGFAIVMVGGAFGTVRSMINTQPSRQSTHMCVQWCCKPTVWVRSQLLSVQDYNFDAVFDEPLGKKKHLHNEKSSDFCPSALYFSKVSKQRGAFKRKTPKKMEARNKNEAMNIVKYISYCRWRKSCTTWNVTKTRK